MNSSTPDPARLEVEALAASVGAPPPPRNLRARRGFFQAVRVAVLIAATAVLVVAVSAFLVGRPRGPAPEAGTSQVVVVERLRVNGVEVPSQVVDVPAAGAVIVIPRAPGRSRLETAPPAPAALATALTTSGADPHTRCERRSGS